MSASGPWYIDSSALVKLVVAEPETPALRAFLLTVDALASSELLLAEVPRACRRTDAASGLRSRGVIDTVDLLVELNREILQSAADLEPPELRSLDAIHLATAQCLQPDLVGVITYDDRLASAAEANGVEVVSPGW